MDGTVAEITRMALRAVSDPTATTGNPQGVSGAITKIRESLNELEQSPQAP